MKNKQLVGGVVTFRVEDDSVVDILNRAENGSATINEALRKHGDEATIAILRRGVEIAKFKMAEAEASIQAERERMAKIQKRLRERK
jgi:hypothetical protein